MKASWKRISSLLLTVVLLISMMPIAVSAASNPMTVTVVAQYGNPVEGATITATYKFVIFGSTTKLSDIEEVGNGVYTVDRDSANSQWYTITLTVSAPGHETATKSVGGNTTQPPVTLTALETPDPT